MRKLMREFRAFAMSGNMLDLALGFIIGTAFAALVQSLAQNILMQFVAAVAGKQDYSKVSVKVGEADIYYGRFVTDLLNFLILTAVLFFVIKMISWLGIARGRVFGRRDCPWCCEEVAVNALVCKFCRQPLVEELPTLAEARKRLESQQARRLPFPFGTLAPLPKPRRRPTSPPPPPPDAGDTT
ncbi:hypothetical protein GCM10009682_06620 [Luedemannella flava]|uniref:Large-conductance mechanosensitive channel n=1 Tax=Luedemannella flava TaxID=349316 RepID=A0ABP4XP69_9ACTN